MGVQGSNPSSCPDLQESTRYAGLLWSYEACRNKKPCKGPGSGNQVPIISLFIIAAIGLKPFQNCI